MSEECKDDHDRLVAHLAAYQSDMRALEDRLKKLNELREQVMNDRGQFLRGDVYDVSRRALETRIYTIERWQSWVVGVVVAAVTMAFVVGAFIERWWK